MGHTATMQTVLLHVPAFNPVALAGTIGIMETVSLGACLLLHAAPARVSPALAAVFVMHPVDPGGSDIERNCGSGP